MPDLNGMMREKIYRPNFDEALHLKKMIYMQFIQIHDLKFPLLKQWTRAQQKASQSTLCKIYFQSAILSFYRTRL